MSSSDSDEDCYGNIALKLQSIKSKFKDSSIKSETDNAHFLDDSFKSDSTSNKVDGVIEIDDNNYGTKCEVSKDGSDVEEISLDAIIAKNSNKRKTRNSNRNADISADNILPSRRKRSKVVKKPSDAVAEGSVSDLNTTNQSANFEPVISTDASVNKSRGRSRGGRRGRRGRGASNSTRSNNASNPQTNSNTTNVNTSETSSANDSQIQTDYELASLLSLLENGPTRNYRSPHRQRTPRRRRTWLPGVFQMFNDRASHSRDIQSNIPTYSVGNTAEYPDECYNQTLFNTQNKKPDEVIVLGENEQETDAIDENEELSVKVYWQNCEVVRFQIRRFQKFTQVFDFFAKRENVSCDKLFFTYNDKILKIDDTPESIAYSIVKFIDGGIINQSVSKIIQKDRSKAKNGLTLKFQCQNVKKPFETTIKPSEKLALAFMMCAEHLEKPLDKLKFHFDGDLISGKCTASELELEGGECIDVTITS